MIDAGKAGNAKAFPLLRRQYDLFNDKNFNTAQAYLYDGIGNGEQGHIASTRMYLETPNSTWADIQTGQDIFRDDRWLRFLIARNTNGITQFAELPGWLLRPNHPHCYEITGFLAFFDQYRATGNSSYLQVGVSRVTI